MCTLSVSHFLESVSCAIINCRSGTLHMLLCADKTNLVKCITLVYTCTVFLAAHRRIIHYECECLYPLYVHRLSTFASALQAQAFSRCASSLRRSYQPCFRLRVFLCVPHVWTNVGQLDGLSMEVNFGRVSEIYTSIHSSQVCSMFMEMRTFRG